MKARLTTYLRMLRAWLSFAFFLHVILFLDYEWHILGYCALGKIPKLKKALQREKITNLTIANQRRNWIHQVIHLRFSEGVNTVKKRLGKNIILKIHTTQIYVKLNGHCVLSLKYKIFKL